MPCAVCWSVNRELGIPWPCLVTFVSESYLKCACAISLHKNIIAYGGYYFTCSVLFVCTLYLLNVKFSLKTTDFG